MSTFTEHQRDSLLLHLWRGAMIEISTVSPEIAKMGVVRAIARVRQKTESSPEHNEAALSAVRDFIEDAKKHLQ